MPTRLLLLLFVVTALTAQAPTPPAFRLPGDVQPARYRLELAVNPDQEEFSGKVAIDVRVTRPTPIIWLNASELTVNAAKLTLSGSTREGRAVPGGENFVGIQFAEQVPAGNASLELEFKGKINSQRSDGLFRHKIDDRWYAYTQFESISARRAFPCFDEPEFKTPWQLTLKVKKDDLAFSNTMPVSETNIDGGTKLMKFAETRPLPSYLVALGVGPFETVSAGVAGNVPIRIITPHGRVGEAAYAVEATAPIVRSLQDYFGVPYAYGKIDLLAVPLFGGAMENAGLITFGDTIILAKPERDSIGRQRMYASIAAHELAHQWTGDLVTTKWWNDIWLNEAFATWMAAKIMDRVKPEWKTRVEDQNAKSGAMSSDSLASARRIRQPVNNNDDIEAAFDDITYEKGGAVIRMFELFVGEDVFRKGVQAYLKKFSDGNATAADFLASITAAVGWDVAPAFSTFLDQPGVPVVTVELKCGGGSPQLEMSQKRSLPLGSSAATSEVWQIPMCIVYPGSGGGRERECKLMQGARSTWALSKTKSCPQWLLANDGEAGYYRTLYRGDLFQQLLFGEGAHLSEAERVGLIQEARDFTESGDLEIGKALQLPAHFASDPSRSVATNVAFIAASVNNDVPEQLRPQYTRFIQKTFGARADELGWKPKPGESQDTKLLRPSLVGLVAREGDDPALRDEARTLALAWIDNRTAVAPELVGRVLNTAAAFGDRALYEKFLAAAKSAKDPRDKGTLISSLGQFRDPAIIRDNFALLLTDTFDARQSLGLLFGPGNYWKTRDMPFEWVKQNYDALSAHLPPPGESDFRAFLPFTAGSACDLKKASEVETFFKDKEAKIVGGPRNLDQTLEGIRLCAAKRQAQQQGLAEFLKNY